MRMTAKDIAREAGVSEATVSLILNGRPARISEKTRQRVQSIAKKYNFSCNQIAVSLATRKTHTLGIILPNLTNALFPRLAAGVEKMAQKNGYALFLCNCEESSDLFMDYLEVMQRRCIDGLIILLPSEIDEKQDLFYQRAYEALSACQVPIVLVERKLNGLPCDFICIDNRRGGEIATEHLVLQGHTHIGHITGTPFFSERTTGYSEALKVHGIPIDCRLIVPGDFSIKSGYQGAKKLIAEGVSAIFAGNDEMALGVARAAAEMGLRIPNDISVVGFDDDPIAKVMPVPLTTILQPGKAMGEKACELLLRRIKGLDEGQMIPVRDYRFEPILIERKSVCRLTSKKLDKQCGM